MKHFVFIAVLIVANISLVFASAIKGTVRDSDSDEPLIGANVVLAGTYLGSTTDEDGYFMIQDIPRGNYTLEVSYLGYEQYEQDITVENADISLQIGLNAVSLVGNAIEIVSNRARERETPVAFTDVKKEEIQARLGSRDIPLVLNTTPSVYSTQQGGGAGDARINVRGFNQRNIAIMINGVPVNDMENGWVYWSNWDGVGDATSSIQMQRGLSAVNLATPSIGGTMNIITDPAAAVAGGSFKQEFGNDGFLKSTLSFNTGLINSKYAFSAAVVRKLGDGLIDATWTDAWAYYFGASYNANQNNRLELYALGAPQRHGQNLYRQNIAVYDQEFAKDLDSYDQAAFDQFNEAGREFNQNWAPVSTSYTGQQAVGDDRFDRHEADFINERENFYHKPQVNLNWFSRLSNDLNLYTILYYSGGEGGGTGTYGDLERKPFEEGELWFASSPWTWDWDATIAMNDTSSTGSFGILRNSRNNQWTIGGISKANYKFSKYFNTTIGIDLRTAEIEHYREIRDLLGGDFFDPRTVDEPVSDFWTGNDFSRGLGDKVDYDFTNNVDWLGVFGQGEYSKGRVTAYGMAGYSQIKYKHTNHFLADDNGRELEVESDWIDGIQAKGGAGYRANRNVHVYGNIGYVAKVPIFDNVISDRTGSLATDPQNEKFISFEAGANINALENQLNFKASLYHTTWNDRANSIAITNPDGTEGLVFITGMDARHQGVEFEAAYQPNRFFRFDGAASVGNWEYTDDVEGYYKDYATGGAQEDTVSYFVDGLKVGDAPQTQFALAGSVYPVRGLMGQLAVRHYRDHYADWDPFSRQDPNDRKQSWKAPSYSVIDLHAYYKLPLNVRGVNPQLFLHVFNLLDELYIQDATDNSQFNSFDQDHDADDAEVFFGLPRFFNLGIQFNF